VRFSSIKTCSSPRITCANSYESDSALPMHARKPRAALACFAVTRPVFRSKRVVERIFTIKSGASSRIPCVSSYESNSALLMNARTPRAAWACSATTRSVFCSKRVTERLPIVKSGSSPRFTCASSYESNSALLARPSTSVLVLASVGPGSMATAMRHNRPIHPMRWGPA
jgi:hypothetical protein